MPAHFSSGRHCRLRSDSLHQRRKPAFAPKSDRSPALRARRHSFLGQARSTQLRDATGAARRSQSVHPYAALSHGKAGRSRSESSRPQPAIISVETIDAIEIAARDCQIAGFCASPIVVVNFAQRSETADCTLAAAVDMPHACVRARAWQISRSPLARPPVSTSSVKLRGQQNAIAGYKPASFSEPPMRWR